MRSIAHGCDLLLYFRWRTASFGTEIYWHGINDYSNVPNRRCAEIALAADDVAKLEGLAGTDYKADVAILRDYENEWDGELDIWHGPLTKASTQAWYAALQRRHIPCDVVTMRPGVDLAKYRCVIYPHAAILSEEVAQELTQFVEQGGTAVFGCRTGYKDSRGHCPMRPMPGPLAALCGVTIEDFTLIGPNEATPHFEWNGRQFDAPLFNEILRSEGAEVLAIYSDAYYAGKPALTRMRHGTGQAFYFGASFATPVAEALIDEIGLKSPVRGEIPEEVEVAIRGDYLFLLNFGLQERNVHIDGVEEITLPAFGTAVLRGKEQVV
jgi:beta-galactosidase